MTLLDLVYDKLDQDFAKQVSVDLHDNGIKILADDNSSNKPVGTILLLTPKTIYSRIQEDVFRKHKGKLLYVVVDSLLNIEETPLSVFLRDYQRKSRILNYPNDLNLLVDSIEQKIIPIPDTEFSHKKSSEDYTFNWQQRLRVSWARIFNHVSTDSLFYDDFEYENFEQNREGNLISLRDAILHIDETPDDETRDELARRLYQPLYCLTIPKDNERDTENRQLYALRPETAVVQQVVCDYLIPILEPEFYPSSYANRMHHSARDTLNILAPWMAAHNEFKNDIQEFARENPDTYTYRGDIRRFYPTINRENLLSLLKTFLHRKNAFDSTIFALVQAYLHIQAIDEVGKIVDVEGLAAGPPLSHLLANFYLHEFDRVMIQMETVKAYFRYSDDVFVFFENQADVIKFENSEFSSLLPDGLKSHPRKGLWRRANESEWLVTELDNLSGYIQSSAYLNIDAADRQIKRETLIEFLNQTIQNFESNKANKDLFWSDDNSEALSRYGPLLIDRLMRLGQSIHQIDVIALRILRVIPLRGHHIRRIVAYFVERLASQTNGEQLEDVPLIFLKNYLPVEAPSYTKVTFLQELRRYSKKYILLNHDVWQFVHDQYIVNKHSIQSGNEEFDIFLYGESALTLLYTPSELTDDFNVSVPPLIKSLDGHLYFGVARDWYLYIHKTRYIDANLIEQLLLHAAVEEIDAILIAFEELDSRYDNLIRMVFDSQIHNSLLLSRSVIRLLYLMLKDVDQSSDNNNVAQAALQILNSYFNKPQTQADILAYLSDNQVPPELLNQVIPANQIFYLETDEEVLNRYKIDIYNTDQARTTMYQHFTQAGDYELKLGTDASDEYIVEIVRTSQLSGNRITSLEWEQILVRLHRNQIIDLVDTTLTKDKNNLIIIYRIGKTYKSIAEYEIQRDDDTSNTLLQLQLAQIQQVNQVFQNLESIVNQSRNSNQKVTFFTPFPCLIFVNDDRSNIRIAGIGASLIGPQYYIPIDIDALKLRLEGDRPEMGSAAYSKFLGYLLFELGSGIAPQRELYNLVQQDKSFYLTNSEIVSKSPVHISSFLQRLTHTDPNSRYSRHKDIDTDITYISSFISTATNYSDEKLFILELVSYINFRMLSHQRNPELRKKEPQPRLRQLFRMITNDLSSFVDRAENRRHWIQSRVFDAVNIYNINPLSNVIYGWLHYTSAHLWQIYLFWWSCLKEYKTLSPRPNLVHGSTMIDVAFLYELLHIELIVFLQSLIRECVACYQEISEFGDVGLLTQTLPSHLVINVNRMEKGEWPEIFDRDTINRVRKIVENAFARSDRVNVLDISVKRQDLLFEELILLTLLMSDSLIVYETETASVPFWSNNQIYISDAEQMQLHINSAASLNIFLDLINQHLPSVSELDQQHGLETFSQISEKDSTEFIADLTANVLNNLYQASMSRAIERTESRIIHINQDFAGKYLKSGRFVLGTNITTGETLDFTQFDLIPDTISLSITREKTATYTWAKADIKPQLENKLLALVPYLPYLPALNKLTRRIYVLYSFDEITVYKTIYQRLKQLGFDIRSYEDSSIADDWWFTLFEEINSAEVCLILLPKDISSLSDENSKIISYLQTHKKAFIALSVYDNVEKDLVLPFSSEHLFRFDASDEFSIRNLAHKLVSLYSEILRGQVELPSKPDVPSIAVVASSIVLNLSPTARLQREMFKSCERAFHNRAIELDVLKTIIHQFRHHPDCFMKKELDELLEEIEEAEGVSDNNNNPQQTFNTRSFLVAASVLLLIVVVIMLLLAIILPGLSNEETILFIFASIPLVLLIIVPLLRLLNFISDKQAVELFKNIRSVVPNLGVNFIKLILKVPDVLVNDEDNNESE